MSEPATNNEHAAMCSACKGACCKRFAGTVYPHQVNPLTAETVLKMLQGDYCLDDYSGDPRLTRRAINNTHPEWHDFGSPELNKRLNTEEFNEFPDHRPDIPIVSQVYYIRPKHMEWDPGNRGKGLAGLVEGLGEMLENIKNDRKVRINKPHHQSWGGTCVFHSEETGCSLKFEDRPYICQKVVPNYNFETKQSACDIPEMVDGKVIFGKRGDAFVWLPYQDILERALELYYEQEKQNGKR